jgi:hypothetical protein
VRKEVLEWDTNVIVVEGAVVSKYLVWVQCTGFGENVMARLQGENISSRCVSVASNW